MKGGQLTRNMPIYTAYKCQKLEAPAPPKAVMWPET